MIWSLAKHHTGSETEAEAATLEIFRELRRCAVNFEATGCNEKTFIYLIAHRRLIK